jgi:thioredoxin reductase (NADPH)
LHLTLLSRAYCHLCDDMQAAVTQLAAARGASLVVVDVDVDPALERAYGELVPVLFAGDPATGVELCHYRLDLARVEDALSGAGNRRIEVASRAKIR